MSKEESVMKKITGLFLGLLLVCLCAFALADVAINETNFPDEIFRYYVQLCFDKDYNDYLSSDEIAAAEELDVKQKSITSLKGVEYLTSLQFLYCSGNKLTVLDVSRNTKLQSLWCDDNQLKNLDVTANTALKWLGCSNNQLTSLDVSRHTALEKLVCFGNPLTSLNLGRKPAMTWLECYYTKLNKLDISGVPAMADLVKNTEPRNWSGTWGEYWYWYDSDLFHYFKADKDTRINTGEKTDISKAKISSIKAQEYTGKAIKPAVTVKYNGTKLKEGTDYTVSWSNNKNIGKATVKVTGKGDYTGEKAATFTINPAKVTLSSLKAGSKQLTVSWKKSKGIEGYEIQYSLKDTMKSAKKVTVQKASTVKTVIKKLKARKTYYVRIRAFKKVNGKTYYSEWSEIRKAKVK